MALPQRKEPDDVRREYDQNERWCESDDDAVARRNDLILRRRRSGWGWLWLIVIALFIWWAIWGWGNSGGYWRGRHNRTIGPGTHNGSVTGGATNGMNTPLPNNYGGMNGSATNGANGATGTGSGATGTGTTGANGGTTSNNNGNAATPHR